MSNNTRLRDIANYYEELVNLGSIKWNPEPLFGSTKHYVDTIIVGSGVTYTVAGVKYRGSFLLRLNFPDYASNSPIKYLNHDPLTTKHMWADDGFHNGLDGDLCFEVFYQMRHGNVSVLNDLFDRIIQARDT